MEKFVSLAVPVLMAALLIRAMLVPAKLLYRACIHGLGGFACLWLLNTLSGFTGILLPMNALTVLIAGFGGIPGIGFITLLEML